MIRKYRKEDEPRVLEIYYDASKIAHDFIPDELLRNDVLVVKEQYLPITDIHVWEEDNDVKGFIALVEKIFIGGFFVDPKYQGRGIGRKLLDYVKVPGESLELNVFKQNIETFEFYKRCGFKAIESIQEGHLGFPEWHMKWIESDKINTE